MNGNTVGVAVGAIIAGVIALLLSLSGPKPQYTADGYTYAIFMLMDRGTPYSQAQEEAAKFYAGQPIARNPLVAPWLHGKPEYLELFSVRQVYSWTASLLYPWRGYAALVDVSRAAYVLTAMLMVVLASRLAPVPYGVVVAVTISLFPPWRDVARDSLTDALAVALTAAAMLAAWSFIRRGSWWRLLCFAVLCGALTFTRPIGYILLGAAAVEAFFAWHRGDRERFTAAAWVLWVAALWTATIIATAQLMHVPSFHWIVADAYQHFVARGYTAPGQNLTHWYWSEEGTIAWRALSKGVLSVVPVLAVIGVVLRGRVPGVPLLAGASVSTWLGAFADPDRFDMIRCIVLPVAPFLAALACAALFAIAGVLPRTGPVAQRLRHFIPGRASAPSHTVEER